ncbi:Uncharacterised protein [Streptococcus pneumoniae]|nr:Uncharacterised protein [Streptococcus pneumoniae]
MFVFADDSLSANSKVVSGEAQFENGSSVRFGDTQVNILSDEVLEVVNPDGSVDTIERRADGVYINGAFYMAYQKNEIDQIYLLDHTILMFGITSTQYMGINKLTHSLTS